jgi:hypothetical protein
MLHELKTWPEPFGAVRSRRKTHEIRRCDRPFAVGDVLRLREWDPTTESYTGEETTCLVTHLSAGGTWGLPVDLCVMSIVVLYEDLCAPGR